MESNPRALLVVILKTALFGKQCKGIPAGSNFQEKRGAVGFSMTNSFSETWKNILSAASIKSLAFPELT